MLTTRPASAGGTFTEVEAGKRAAGCGDPAAGDPAAADATAAAGPLEARAAAAAQPALEAWSRRGLDGTVKLGQAELPAAFALL